MYVIIFLKLLLLFYHLYSVCHILKWSGNSTIIIWVIMLENTWETSNVHFRQVPSLQDNDSHSVGSWLVTKWDQNLPPTLTLELLVSGFKINRFRIMDFEITLKLLGVISLAKGTGISWLVLKSTFSNSTITSPITSSLE